MARGNSKLYRIKESNITTIPVVSNYNIEKAWFKGFMFIQEENKTEEIRMITTTCSKKSFQVELVNVDVVTEEGIKNYRF